MIFTCNFANWRKIPVNVCPISVALYPPTGWEGASYFPLFPTTNLLDQYKRGIIGDVQYSELYKKHVLSRLLPEKVVNDLYDMKPEDCSGVVLLCYENSDKFCHRHLISSWLNAHNFIVREFSVKTALRNSLGLLRKKHD